MTKQQQVINHPKAGSKITVDPVRNLIDIQEIKGLIYSNPLYSALFCVGINTGLRASDLLKITAEQVCDLKPMDEITVKEKKTGNIRRITLNGACIEAINRLLAASEYQSGASLFSGQRGALTVSTVGALVKKWCRQVGLRGNFASHTLRKTFGYHQRTTFGVCLPELMKVFGHSSERQTLAYIGIQEEAIKNIYTNAL